MSTPASTGGSSSNHTSPYTTARPWIRITRFSPMTLVSVLPYADSSGCRWPSFHAVTLKLPCVMADPVKPKRLCSCLDGPDFVFDLVGLNRLVAQRAWQAGSETAPKPCRRLAGYLCPCDALTCEGPQFF